MIKLLQMCFGPGFKYRGLLLVLCMGRVVWFGGHEGQDSLVSWQVCSFKPMVPEGGAWKRKEREWFLAEEELVMLVTLSHWMVLSCFVSCKLTLLSFGAGLKST